MSWYVRRLLLDRDAIRSSMTSTFDNRLSHDYYEERYQIVDLDLDVYSDLLTVEMKLKQLLNSKLIAKDEIKVLEYMLSNRSIAKIEYDENISRPTIIKKFDAICDRIAFHLGGMFTDDGFIEYISNKYDLTDNDIQKIKLIINNEES